VQYLCTGAGFDILTVSTSAATIIRLPPVIITSSTTLSPQAPSSATGKAEKPSATDGKTDGAAATAATTAATAKTDASAAAGNKEKEGKKKAEKADSGTAGSSASGDAGASAGADAEPLDPSKLDIRVGLVVKCWNHPDSDKLLCEEIDLGEGTVRSIASGIRPHYTAEGLQGKKVAVLANLKDRTLAGFKSQVGLV
jgi:methionine--tRNA ligase beta chain